MDAKEAERLKRFYAGPDYAEARTVRDRAFCQYGDERWTLPDFLAIVNNAAASIPEKARDAATVECNYETSGKLVIEYDRLETDAEVADRVKRCEDYVREREAHDKAEYRRLKAKFDATP